MARSYSFAILQAIPDRTRSERVNVGIVVGTPDGIDLRVPELRKLQLLSGHGWGEIVDAYGRRISKEFERATSLSDLRERIGVISEIFTLSDLGSMLADEKTYEQRISAILQTYVNRPQLTRRQKEQKINAEIARYFKNAGILVGKGQTIEDHKVVAKYMISEEEDIRADFAYKNGRMKVVSTLDLRTNQAAHSRACERGAVLYFAKEKFGSTTRPFGIYAVAEHQREERHSEIKILESFADGNIFNWLDIQDRQRFSAEFY